MVFVYILSCCDGTFYTGWTNDLKARVEKHNRKKGAKYTRGRTPVNLVYVEEVSSVGEALKREAAIKKLSRKEKEKLVANSEGITYGY